MYRQHFGLGEHPFSLTPDTQFFFNSESHRQILSTVLLALRHSEGFIKIVGEVGTGKTLLSRMLLAGLDDHFITACISNPYLTPEELKWFLAEEIGIAYSPATPSYQLLKDIKLRLVELAEQKRQVVLVVDEAQAMPRETIEALRLLTNLETEKNKLLQVVLIGQPELDDLLNRPDLRQLKQRIVFSEYLQGIPRKKIASYIASRLSSAGFRGEKLFSSSAIALLYRASGGVPRLINVIAHKAMLAAYGEKSEQVRRAHVASAIANTQESRSIGRMLATPNYWVWPSVAAASVSALVIFSLSSYNNVPQVFHEPKVVVEQVKESVKPAVAAVEKVDEVIVKKSVPENTIVKKAIGETEVAETVIENEISENANGDDNLQLQNRIADLLLQANRAMAMDRLTSPIEDNAFGYYQKILGLSPNDQQAKVGIEAIAARYLAKAQEQMNLGNRTQAETFLQRANVVAPGYSREREIVSTDSRVANSPSIDPTVLSGTQSLEPAPTIKSEVIKSFEVTEASSVNITSNARWKDEQMAVHANELVQQNKIAQAIELLKNFIVTESKPVQSAEVLADIYLQQGNTQAAEVLLQSADYLPPVAKAKMKAHLFAAKGDTSAAIIALEEQLSAADDNEQYSAFLASLYHKTGQYQQSVVSYQRLLKRYGEKPAYWLGLALAFDGLTQHNNALQAYQHLREFPQLQVQVKTYVDQRIVALRSE